MRSTKQANSAEELASLTVEAESALAREDWRSAAAAYEKLVASQPKDSEHRFNLVRAYDELGQAEQALKVLQHPSIAHLDKTKRRLARTYIDLKDYAAAIPLVDELVAANPGNAKFAKWKAVLDEKSGPDANAAELMQRGQELFDSERFVEAEQLFLELLQDYPGFARASLYLGKIYAEQKRWTEEIPPLRRGLATDPDNRKLKNTLARALFKDGQVRAAVALLESGNGPRDDIDALFLLQRCHLELHNWKLAQDIGERLLGILPPADPLRPRVVQLTDEAAVRSSLATIAAAADPGKAIGEYRELASQHPASPHPWLALGAALVEAGRADEAIAALRDARAAHPESLDIRTALSRAIISSADEETILRHSQQAAKDHGGDFESFRWLARHHAEREEWDEAAEMARGALGLEPQSDSARVVLVRALFHLARYAEALEELDPLLASGEKRVEALQLKGDILFRLSRLREAIRAYREAAELAPKDPVLTRSLADALLLSRDVEGFHRWHERRDRVGLATVPEWDGQLAIEGKLLVWADANVSVGEQILHLRFLRQLIALGFEIVVEVDESLLDICRRSFPQVTAVASEVELPDGISRETALTGLFGWFKPDLQSLASEQPYLAPDIERLAAERARLQGAAGEDKFLIGIDWRSDDLHKIIDRPRATLVDLRKGGAVPEMIAAMDLVVCGDGGIAHLAGAMGVPGLVILPPLPSAYWLAAGERCVWYPSLRLIRQASIDDGQSAVLDEAAAAVEQFQSGYDPAQWLSNSLVAGRRAFESHQPDFSHAEAAEAARCFVAQGPQHYPAYRSALRLIDRMPDDQLSRELTLDKVDLLVRLGELSAARALLQSMRPEIGRDSEVERLMLSVSLAMYDLDYALLIARELAMDDPQYRMTAANILYSMGAEQEALTELRAASRDAPDLDGLTTLFGTLLLDTGEAARAAAYLNEQVAATRTAADYALLGRAFAEIGKATEALSAFEQALRLSPEDPAANFWRTRHRIAVGAVTRTPLPPLQGDMPTASAEDLVIFFVADSGYFWEHGLVLLGSIVQQSPGAKCHVHIVNPDGAISAAIEEIRKSLPGLSYSYERVDFAGRSQDYVRTYYASIRFVRIAEIFASAPATYLCIDSDCIVRGDVGEAASALDVTDVAVRLRYSDRPHVTVAAGALMLRPTAGAATFAKRVAELISLVLESGEAAWFLDQVVLSYTVREARKSGIEVTQLEIDWIDWFFRDQSLIWTGKGPRKSEDERYIDEASSYRCFLETARKPHGAIVSGSPFPKDHAV
jgi:tetratricopeptide (TPR) repeat protein